MLQTTLKKLLLLVGFFASLSLSAQSLDDAIKNLDAERFTAANKIFADLSKNSPSAVNNFYKGYALLRSPEGMQPETIKEATDSFNAGVLLDKKDFLNTIGLGMAKLAAKDAAGAKLIFEEVKKSTKLKNTDALYRIAEAYTLFPGATDAGEAIMSINMALDKSKAKDNPEYYIVKSDAYMLKNEGGDAMNALQNAERLGKKLGRIYEKSSRVWLQSKNYKEASEALKKGIAADPTHAPIYKFESSYNQTMGKFPEAAASAKKYLDNSDGDCKAKSRYAKLAFVAKDFSSVLNIINEVKSCSKDPFIDRMTGIINFETGKPKEAIADIMKFINSAPKEENLGLDYGYIGRSYLSMTGSPEEKKMSDSLGIINIEKAVQLGDTSFNYYQDAANVFYKNKNYNKAAFYEEKNVKGKKNATAADFANVGNRYAADKNWTKAEEYVEKALPLYKDAWLDGYAFLARVKVYKNNKDSVYTASFGAASTYETYLEKIGADLTKGNKRNVKEALTYLAGKEFQVNKNKEKALTYLDKVLVIDPADEAVKKQIDAIKGIVPAPAAVPAPAPGTPAPATKVPGKI